jgi:hypothetical protein
MNPYGSRLKLALQSRFWGAVVAIHLGDQFVTVTTHRDEFEQRLITPVLVVQVVNLGGCASAAGACGPDSGSRRGSSPDLDGTPIRA